MFTVGHHFSWGICRIVFSRWIIFLTSVCVVNISSFWIPFAMKIIILLLKHFRITKWTIMVCRSVVLRYLGPIIIRLSHFTHWWINLILRALISVLIRANWCVFKLIYEFIYLIYTYSSCIVFIKYFKYLHILLPVEVQF